MKIPISYWSRLRRRPLLSLSFDVLIIISVFLLIHSWNTRQLPRGEQVPGLELPALDGMAVEAALPHGTVGVVYFFAPWCFYCRNSIDNLDSLVAEGVIDWARAVALDYQDINEVREFVKETGLVQPVFLGNRNTSREWGIRAFPTYFVINAEGAISSRSVGYSSKIGLKLRSRLAN